MTQVKSVNLDELSSVYPITGKVKNIILNISTSWKLKVQRFKMVPASK